MKVGYGPCVPSLQERVQERRRAVAIARHLREGESLSIAQIAARLGRSQATVKGYFYDPTGAKAKAVKARYQGSCRQCGAPTQARGGKGDAYTYCKNCHPARSRRAGRGSSCSRRCAPGGIATGGRRARMTGRAPTLAGADPTRSPASKSASGHPPARSPTCSARGRRPGRRRSPERHRRGQRGFRRRALYLPSRSPRSSATPMASSDLARPDDSDPHERVVARQDPLTDVADIRCASSSSSFMQRERRKGT